MSNLVFPPNLSGLGRSLDERHAVAARQLLCLTRLHGAGAQVTLVAHQYHGNAVAVLHPVDLFSEEETQEATPQRSVS